MVAHSALLPKPPKRGRKSGVDLREVLSAIRFMARSGGGWRMLPTNSGLWQTVYWYSRRFVRRMLLQTIRDVSLMLDRERIGRKPVVGCRARQSHREGAARTGEGV